MLHRFSRLLLPIFTLFVAPAALATDECPLSDYNRLEQQWFLGLFGGQAGKHFTDIEHDKKLLDEMGAETIKACTQSIPELNPEATEVYIKSMIGFAVLVASFALVSVFTGFATTVMTETEVESRNKKLRQGMLAIIVLVAATPFGLLVGDDEEKKGLGEYALEDAYSLINIGMFKLLGSASITADKIDRNFSNNTDTVMPFYVPPAPSYMAAKKATKDEASYSQNDMSHLLQFSTCAIAELPPAERDTLADNLTFSETETNYSAAYGAEDSACRLMVSMPKNVYTAAQIESEYSADERALFEDKEQQLFANTVRSVVNSALNYRSAQFKGLDENLGINEDEQQVLVDRKWYTSCPKNLAEITTANSSGRSKISALVSEDRKAELCLSKTITQKFYPPKYQYSGTRVSYQPKCESGDLRACALSLCDFDPEKSQTGVFDCAVAMEALSNGALSDRMNKLGWAVKPLNLISYIERNEPPTEPQSSLSSWSFESEVNISEASMFESGAREVNEDFREALADSGVGALSVSELLKRHNKLSKNGHDLFDVLRVDTCLQNPNQILTDDDGLPIASCGTPIQTLRELGDSMINFWLYMQAGHYSKGLLSKLTAKSKDSEKKTKKGDGKMDSTNTDKNAKATVIGTLTAVFGAVVFDLFPEFMSIFAETPFSAPSGGALDLMTGAAAFTSGMVLGDGMINISGWLLLVGFLLKYILPLLLVMPFYGALLWLIIAFASAIGSAIFLVLQPLVSPHELERRYTALVLKMVGIAVNFCGLIILFNLTIIFSEQVLPVALGGVSELVGHINTLSGVVSSILFGAVVFTLLYVFFVIVLINKLLDVYKVGGEFSQTLFRDSAKIQAGGEEAISGAKQQAGFAKSLIK